MLQYDVQRTGASVGSHYPVAPDPVKPFPRAPAADPQMIDRGGPPKRRVACRLVEGQARMRVRTEVVLEKDRETARQVRQARLFGQN